ncbi:MAG: phosphotransferase [Burkholderiales bacterium]|nr:phosphotransferase [Burkholderiales bacterium]
MSATPGPDVLARVPGADSAVPPQVESLTGGLTNRSFRVTTSRGRYVVRLGTAYDALLAIDRRVETLVQRLAAGACVAPRVVDADIASGLLITEYVEGRSWTAADFADPRQIDRLGERLAALQAIDARATPGLARLDPVALARGYVQRIVAAAPEEQRHLAPLLIESERRWRDSGAFARSPVLAHSDLHGSNLVDGGTRLWLIDWEYAALTDPLHDVACVLAYHPEAVPHLPRLLAALGLERVATPVVLDAAIWLFQLLVLLWYRARRVAVAASAAEQAAEERAARALASLVHNRSLWPRGV